MKIIFAKTALPISLAILGVVITGFVLYQYAYAARSLGRILASVTAEFTATVRQLDQNIATLREENTNLISTLDTERNRNNVFSAQIQSMQSTVNVLEKLSKTDKELLMKYSRVYFLNENYIPASISVVAPQYTYNKNETYAIHTSVQPYLYRLLSAAAADNVNLLIVSAYRSFEAQASLKSGYKMVYGSGANQFSADQGYSEHQLGTTVDLTTAELGGTFSSTKFAASSAYSWLTNNAYKYGFILSYPKGNTYYQFEPWHWRFVGVQLATRLHDAKQNFYDLDQREIDQYLVSLFD